MTTGAPATGPVVVGPSPVAASENPHAGQGSVMLDIGDAIGALVVAMPSSMLGVEIEIGTADREHPATGDPHRNGHDHPHDHSHGHRPHVAVVNRPVSGGEVPSLVFPELVEGRYGLYAKGEDDVLLTAEIVGGQVTILDWPRG